MKLSIHCGFTCVVGVQIFICHEDMKTYNLRPWSGCYKVHTARRAFVSQGHRLNANAVARRKQFTCRCAMGWLTLDDQAAPSKHALELRMSLNSHTLQLCTMHHQKSIKQSDKQIHTQQLVTLLKVRGKTTVAIVDNSHAQGISVFVHVCSTETITHKNRNQP